MPFKFLGGVSAFVKIDNLKAAILEANFYEPVYQQMYKDFAEFYSFSLFHTELQAQMIKAKPSQE